MSGVVFVVATLIGVAAFAWRDGVRPMAYAMVGLAGIIVVMTLAAVFLLP